MMIPLRNHNTAKTSTDPLDTVAATGTHHGLAERRRWSTASSGCRNRMKSNRPWPATALERYTRAIEASIDPSNLVGAMNTAQAERAAAQVELDTIPRPVQAQCANAADHQFTWRNPNPTRCGRPHGQDQAVQSAGNTDSIPTDTAPRSDEHRGLLRLALVSGEGIDHYANLLQHRKALVIGK